MGSTAGSQLESVVENNGDLPNEETSQPMIRPSDGQTIHLSPDV